jgi:tetratricopeptide (TPR) repeat protein
MFHSVSRLPLPVNARFYFYSYFAIALAAPATLPGGDLEEARKLFKTGKYAECTAAAAAIQEGSSSESWYALKIRSQLAAGDHPGALETLKAALEEHPSSIRLRWLGRPAYLAADKVEEAEAALGRIGDLLERVPWRYRDPADRVVIGRFLLQRGADARQVLEAIYDRIKKEHPDFAGAYIASGDLALEKHDHAVAAQEFERALKLAPEDPDILFRLACARAGGDAVRAEQNLRAALDLNPNHTDSLLYLIDGAIDREAYDEARELIERVLAVHPQHPRALAYRAVLAHLAGDRDGEKAARAAALATWSTNPGVDCLIGRKLSQKYRFAEGAACQRRALGFDADYLPAKIELCQDLLRLGQEDEGWRLAGEVYEKDGYNVVAHNLDVLRDHLATFRTLEAEGLVVRMDAHEAGVYGERVLDLLRRARETLCAKYDVEIAAPTVVEIFPEQKDFAIRTFGLPGGAGFLGVCFGSVITANSPASQGEHPSNWAAMLWHEFCHVVTLNKTRNKMPRWLSEGISVYEEKQANRAWGQKMTPQYLELIAGGGLTPVSELSGAFLHPPSPLHLQFAYYQSSLVVEFLIARHGLDTLKEILTGLADGTSINRVLERHIGSIEELDREAEAFIRSRAAELAARADWDRPGLAGDPRPEELAAWVREHPDSFWGLQRHALQLMAEKRWQEAKKPLLRLLALCPGYTGPDNAYELLAAVHRQLSEADAEREVLAKLTELDGDAAGALLRLLELCAAAKEWRGLGLAAERLLAVNPLLKAPHRHFARAMEELDSPARAIPSYRSLLLMDPLDPAGMHFRLARRLREEGRLEEAKRQLLAALEEAPRFRDAHRELLALVRQIAARCEQGSPGTSNGKGEP